MICITYYIIQDKEMYYKIYDMYHVFTRNGAMFVHHIQMILHLTLHLRKQRHDPRLRLGMADHRSVQAVKGAK